MNCNICKDEGWVCEAHENKAWNYGDGCCGGAGMPCKCNKADPPWHHNTERVTWIAQFKGDTLVYTKDGIYKIREKKGKRK